jgi:hypothetical protein
MKPPYATLREGYTPGSAMSIYGSLKGGSRRFDKDVRCWCDQAVDPKVKLPSEMFPIQLCDSCKEMAASAKK